MSAHTNSSGLIKPCPSAASSSVNTASTYSSDELQYRREWPIPISGTVKPNCSHSNYSLDASNLQMKPAVACRATYPPSNQQSICRFPAPDSRTNAKRLRKSRRFRVHCGCDVRDRTASLSNCRHPAASLDQISNSRCSGAASLPQGTLTHASTATKSSSSDSAIRHCVNCAPSTTKRFLRDRDSG